MENDATKPGSESNYQTTPWDFSFPIKASGKANWKNIWESCGEKPLGKLWRKTSGNLNFENNLTHKIVKITLIIQIKIKLNKQIVKTTLIINL